MAAAKDSATARDRSMSAAGISKGGVLCRFVAVGLHGDAVIPQEGNRRVVEQS